MTNEEAANLFASAHCAFFKAESLDGGAFNQATVMAYSLPRSQRSLIILWDKGKSLPKNETSECIKYATYAKAKRPISVAREALDILHTYYPVRRSVDS